MDHFELVSEYAPTGDQPQAIAKLVEGFKEGNQYEKSGIDYEKGCMRQVSETHSVLSTEEELKKWK